MPHDSKPLPPPEQMEDAITIAALSHATARSPRQRAEAWAWLMRLKREQERRRNGPFAKA